MWLIVKTQTIGFFLSFDKNARKYYILMDRLFRSFCAMSHLCDVRSSLGQRFAVELGNLVELIFIQYGQEVRLVGPHLGRHCQ